MLFTLRSERSKPIQVMLNKQKSEMEVDMGAARSN